MDNEELELNCTESCSDISFSDSLEEEEWKMYLEDLGSDSDTELSFNDWLHENNHTKIENNHQQDVAELDLVKGLDVEDKNELSLKPRKRMKSMTDNVDSTNELLGFSFYGEETAPAKVEDDSTDKNNSEVSTCERKALEIGKLNNIY